MSEMGEWNGDFGVFQNEMLIEIGKAQEGLDVFDLLGFRPILNDLDFVRGHSEATRREYTAQILDGRDMEKTLIGAGIEVMLLELSENFLDMALVFFLEVGVDEDVIQVHQYTNIEQVTKNIIHEVLESGRCIGESERHYMPFKGAVASLESCLPFVTLLDSDQMVGMLEVDFQIDFGLVQAVKEVGNARQRAAVLLHDFIQTAEVDAKPEQTVFLVHEEDQSSTWRLRWVDEIHCEMFV